MRIEEMQEKYRISQKMRIELFGEHLLAINEELKRRDLSEISTPKLFEMMIRCVKALEAEMVEPLFLSEAEMEHKRDERILANNMVAPEIAAARKRTTIKQTSARARSSHNARSRIGPGPSSDRSIANPKSL
jgi:hypothetical protein